MPLELQDHIWEFAIASIPPRVVEIRYTTRETRYGSFEWYTYESSIPALLHATGRSRELAQLRWKLRFTTFFVPGAGLSSHWSPKSIVHSCVFFNDEIDTLLFTGNYFEFERFFRFDATGADRCGIRNLTVNIYLRDASNNIVTQSPASGYVRWLATKIPLIRRGFPNANLVFVVKGIEIERHIVGRNGREVVFMDGDEEIQFADGENVLPGIVRDVEFREGPRTLGDDIEALSLKQQIYKLRGWPSPSISLVPTPPTLLSLPV